MSHCTTFQFAYTSEEMLVATLLRLGLQPTTGVVADYGSDFSKKILGRLGYAGSAQTRAIIARDGELQYFLRKAEDGYQLSFETGAVLTPELQARMRLLEQRFRIGYVTLAMERVAEGMAAAGLPAQVQASGHVLTLAVGADQARSVRVVVQPDGMIEEEVFGVMGQGCTDLTAELEQLLSHQDAELNTRWKPEYSQAVEDQVVQVLRLS